MHPEELLDKEAVGSLTGTERAYLRAHTSRCVACRCERRLRAEFAAALASDVDVWRRPVARRRRRPSG